MTYQLGLYEKAIPDKVPLEEKLREARAAGYDYLELSIDETPEKLARLHWNSSDLRSVARAMDRAGVPILSLCLSAHRRFPLGHPDHQVQRESLRILQKAVGLCGVLGIRLIQIAGYDVYYESSTEQTRAHFQEALVEAVDIASAAGVMLAFETMETDFMNTTGKAMRWVSALPSPYLQVYPDIGNITNATPTPLADLERGIGHLAAAHLKETRPGMFRKIPYGEGHVDFFSAVKTLLRLGVRLFVGEFWCEGDEQWRETLWSNHAFLSSHLDNAAKMCEDIPSRRTGNL